MGEQGKRLSDMALPHSSRSRVHESHACDPTLVQQSARPSTTFPFLLRPWYASQHRVPPEGLHGRCEGCVHCPIACDKYDKVSGNNTSPGLGG